MNNEAVLHQGDSWALLPRSVCEAAHEHAFKPRVA